MGDEGGRFGAESAPAWTDPLSRLDARSPDAVCDLLDQATEANHNADCRVGSVDLIEPTGTLIATGDLHDNPLHLARLAQLAEIDTRARRAGDEQNEPHAWDERSESQDPDRTNPQPKPTAHLTLHEIIHADSPTAGLDLSHRALLRIAAMKREHPERVHTLLANHELAQIVGAGIVKEGVRVVDAFNEGVERVYRGHADRVLDAIAQFIRSLPLALVSRTDDGRGVLCAHSLPGPEMMDRFDPAVLEHDLTEADYEPRKGAAHLMVWGRRQTPEQLQSLAERWRVSLFILGHQKTEQGWMILPPNAIVLNSDHAAGVALPIDLADPPPPSDAVWRVVPLQSSDDSL